MADIDKLIPHIIRWETGIKPLYGESLERLFERSRKSGYSYDTNDSGGHTQTGITLRTFTSFRKFAGRKPPELKDLKNISYQEWKEVLISFFWNKVHGGAIKNDSVACMICDWFWTSGTWGLKRIQKVLKVTQDGLFGIKTLGAINKWPDGQEELWNALKKERLAYYKKIAVGKQKKHLNGWNNRVNDMKWEE